MLFLVKVEIEKLNQMPVKDFFQLLIKEWEFYERMKKRGKVLAGGKLAGRRGAAAIFDAEDHAEIEAIVTRLPLFPLFTKIEITPLVDQEKALLDARRMYQMVKDLDTMIFPSDK
ncbi:MAG: muconolactone Delta-isomerase family protein [Candidatus Brocadiales bacterium]|jgi:muconolactone D-isomerase